MDYALKSDLTSGSRATMISVIRSLAPFLAGEGKNIVIAFACIAASSAASLLGPILIAQAIDAAIALGDFDKLLRYAVLLAAVYLAALGLSYQQMLRTGIVGRNVVFRLRNRLFAHLAELPVAFFVRNRTGDLISRVNNDTQQINLIFSGALMQIVGTLFQLMGAGALLLSLDWRLGLIALLPAFGLLAIVWSLSPYVKRTNHSSLESLGALSGDISESLANFRVFVAFNRIDYLGEKLAAANVRNYRAGLRAGISSGMFLPLCTLASNVASILVLGAGIWLLAHNELTTGLLIAYLLYVTAFYNPLGQVATTWSSVQTVMAAVERVYEVLDLKSDLIQIPDHRIAESNALLAFEQVSFSYHDGARVLENVSFVLERGRSYALVGPTGGGKTTTAMLMARLYDPSHGKVYLNGRDIRSVTASERARTIGFILQDPVLLSGTVRDNLVYCHDELETLTDDALAKRIATQGLAGLIARFPAGLATPITGEGNGLSLGQKQLLAFMRAVLREPELLILDEATANIDTVTEQLLQDVLDKLPSATTKVIIAHRFNTIRAADEIFFVGGGSLIEAGSMQHAMDMLLENKGVS